MPVLELSALQGKERIAYCAGVQAPIQKVKVVEVRVTMVLMIIRKYIDRLKASSKVRRAEGLATDSS